MLKKLIHMLLCVTCALININCASIVSGRHQKVPVVTIPDGATVTVESSKQTTPTTLMFDRNHNFYVVKIEKDGFKTVEVTFKRGNNNWIWGNVLFGGIIGLVIDFSTSSAYKFTPDHITVNLEQSNAVSSEKTEEAIK